MTAAPRAFTVQVPGKVMLAGEYCVLGGGQALAAAVGAYLTVHVRGRPGVAQCLITSDLWDEPRRVTRSDYGSTEPLTQAVARGLMLYDLSGVEVEVTSELEPSFGIGSSSAVRLGALLGLAAYAYGSAELPHAESWRLAAIAHELQQATQSRASGYDVAAQLAGGLTLFTPPLPGQSWPGAVAQVGCGAPALGRIVHVFIGGGGAPTGPVMRDTLAWLEAEGKLATLEAASTALVAAFTSLLSRKGEPSSSDLAALSGAVGRHRQILAAAPHAPAALSLALAALPGCDQTWSFKTTGAGGEDALLLIGSEDDVAAAAAVLKSRNWRPLPAAFTATGARIQAADAAVDQQGPAAATAEAAEEAPHA